MVKIIKGSPRELVAWGRVEDDEMDEIKEIEEDVRKLGGHRKQREHIQYLLSHIKELEVQHDLILKDKKVLHDLFMKYHARTGKLEEGIDAIYAASRDPNIERMCKKLVEREIK